jgi:hypothetical protein
MIKYLFSFLVLTVLPMYGHGKSPYSRTAVTSSTQPTQRSQNKSPEPQPEKPSAVTFVDDEQTNPAPNPVDESSPSFYTAIKNPEWWLFLAALATLGVIGKQAREMAKATEEMKKSTAAVEKQAVILERQAKAGEDALTQAKMSSDVLANIERAWIDVRLLRHAGNSLYTLEITNYGRTVAHIRQIITERTFTEGENSPASLPTITTYGKSKLLVPNQPWPVTYIDLGGDLGQSAFQKLVKGDARLDYHIIVKYAGIRPDSQSECLYYWKHAPSSGCLVPVEAEEYNQHT